MNEGKFKLLIKSRGLTARSVSEKLGMSTSSFYRKLKNNSFGLVEVELMIRLLKIDKPEEIFFDKELT